MDPLREIGHLLKNVFTSLLKRKSSFNTIWGFEEGLIDMSSPELETSGPKERVTSTKFPVLPDGKTPIQIGSGVITGILGEGGSAIIYEIKNNQLGLQRAVKLLKPPFSREKYNRFLREFRISVQLSHPNLVVVHAIGQWNKIPFIEMEKVNGFSLSEIVSQFGPLPLGLVTAIGIIICKALEYLHNCTYEIDNKKYKGLLHLDLKPSNIILSDAGVLKIMDFGLSTPAQEVENGSFVKVGSGSPQYSAPELLLGNDTPDVRSDIYSLGCILYELISGVKTFPGPEEDAVMELRTTNTYISLKKLAKTVPTSLLKLIEECLDLRKENRPLTVEIIRKELEKIHQKATRLSPENTILLYVNKRKTNTPFTLPKPYPSVKAIFISSGVVVVVSFIIAVILAGWFNGKREGKLSLGFSNIFQSLSSKGKINITDSLKNSPKEEVESLSIDSKTVEDTYFYLPELSVDEAKLLDSVRIAWTQRKFDLMLSLINRLPAELANSKEVSLLKLRALGRGGEELGKVLAQKEINDGEYYFHKARYLYGKKDYKNALICLDKAQTLPSEFIDKRILGRESQLYRARVLTLIFRTNPTSENLNAALEAWDKLLKIVSDNPQGMHSKEAQKEKQNLLAEAEWRGIY